MLDAAPGHSVGPAGGIVTEVHVLPASINGRPAKIKRFLKLTEIYLV